MCSRPKAVLLSALIALVTLSACSGDGPEPTLAPPLNSPTETELTYNPSLEPAAAVLSLVPANAVELRVTDFDQLRYQLGYGDMSSATPAPIRERFWREAMQRSALLDPGLLRQNEDVLETQYQITQDDVSWEAHFTGPDGPGWVLKLHDDAPFGGLKRAIAQEVVPFQNATFYSTTRVVLFGSAITDPTDSLRSDDDVVELVGGVAGSTYVANDCLSIDEVFGDGVASQLAPALQTDIEGLDELGPFAVSFGGALVTVHLGAGRSDAFDRARLVSKLPRTLPDFGLGYTNPVADPGGGRLGYTLGDAAAAARLARERQLPFAVCAG